MVRLRFFQFGLFNGALEEHSVLLDLVSTWVKSLLLQRQPSDSGRHRGEPIADGAREKVCTG